MSERRRERKTIVGEDGDTIYHREWLQKMMATGDIRINDLQDPRRSRYKRDARRRRKGS